MVRIEGVNIPDNKRLEISLRYLYSIGAAQQGQIHELEKALLRPKKKVLKDVPVGVVYVKATFNNTIITITDPSGQITAWSSAGKSGYSTTVAAQDAANIAIAQGLKKIEVNLRGPGAGREPAVRSLMSAGLTVTAIRDATPVPHNG
ncbi:hypothetical protein ACTFIW_000815 [Dictyostelium discoideum]